MLFRSRDDTPQPGAIGEYGEHCAEHGTYEDDEDRGNPEAEETVGASSSPAVDFVIIAATAGITAAEGLGCSRSDCYEHGGRHDRG